MKTKLNHILLTLATVAVLALTGCASEQVTTDSAGLSQTNYAPNQAAMQVSATAKSLAPVVAATVPPPYGALAGLALGLLGLVGGGVAKAVADAKNKKTTSTLTAVTAGIESALPSIQEALTTTATSGVVSSGDAANLAKANAILSAVKDSIHSATVASGTAQTLDQSLAQSGIGPTAR